jgi:hypothetical protein
VQARGIMEFESSSMVFPSSLIFGKIVWAGILLFITLFKQETWNIGCTCEDGGKSNL